MLTVNEFRMRNPSFVDEKFTEEQVRLRLTLADRFLSESIWSDVVIRDHAIELYAAHFLTMSEREASDAGLVSSMSADGVSVSYDTTTAAEASAGMWNETVYGRELWSLMRVFGAGAVQL